jgi:cytochrome c5
MSTNTQKALAAASALLLGVPTAALSHTNSIGYVGAGNGTVTFWYGNWHPGTTFTEGSMTLLGVNGTNYSANTVNWTLLQNSLPTGLVNGTNYFTSDGSQLVPYGSNSQVSYTWQGVTFTGLGAGDYQFTYNPIAQPTANWAPMDNIIKTSTVSLSSAIINNTCNTCQGTSAPTVTSTAPGSDIVTTSTTYGTRTVTGHPHRHVFGTDANGNQTETHYLDDAVTTIPTTTVTTTTTPVTVTTWSDGSTTTTNGTPTTTSVTTDDNGGTTVVTQTNNIEWVKTRTYDVQRTAYSPSGAPTIVNTPNWTPTESSGKQKLNLHLVTGVTTPTTRAVTTTAVYTKVYTDGVTPTAVTNGTPVVTYETSSTYDEYHTYKDWYGRVDLDGISGSLNGLLDHEPITNHKKRFRVFENTRFAQSYNADGYKASSTIIGGGFEYDITKGWTAGAQYNDLYTEMLGVDSLSHLKRQHVGIFNSFHGRDIALVTNAGASQDKYDYARTLEYQFGNWGKVEGTQWWVHNRMYFNNSGWFKPFLGYTVSNVKRNAYSETGSPESARSVDAFNQTTHVGEVGLKLETRFGGKKHDAFGVSVDGSYATDNSYGVTAALDYKEVLFVEGSYGVADGVTTNSVAAKVKFRF